MQTGGCTRLSVAPMMDWTDRHCRYFHRQLTRQTLLYTEMVTTSAIRHGDVDRLLAFDPCERPLALQIGGVEPQELFDAVQRCTGRGFDEINLNAGCPSDKVQAGGFGAVLMKDPVRAAACLRAMQDAAEGIEITLKCRIGVDDQNPEICLPEFLSAVADSGVNRITIHARKAWLRGLSPKQNRDIPPLDYPLVLRMKDQFPQLKICINGGIECLTQAERYLAAGLDGVMIGRAAYRTPARLLAPVDQRIFGQSGKKMKPNQVAAAMVPYLRQQHRSGVKVTAVTRHMLGLFAGQSGARTWRQMLSNPALNGPEGIEFYWQAVRMMENQTNDNSASMAMHPA
ncbi:MAG: tRNA dihydrouridine(20/20a) synthase DusA [Rhodobacteraceae bacterium]|nr:tRNA dihydrouridine(20/20a) synthase DusA [Paracoccaceae bacterium]